MAMPPTRQEWTRMIAETADHLAVSDAASSRPTIGTPAFAATIDHTLLKTDATPAQIDALCAEARVEGFASVCVRPHFVERCAGQLRGSGVRIAAVVGFHEGTQGLPHKLQESATALRAGAAELDVVLDYPALLARRFDGVYAELAALRRAAPAPTLLKLILETSQLARGDVVAACALAAAAGFDFVKTSTGFNGPGATEAHVRLMTACCEHLAVAGMGGGGGKVMRVKASGGIRSLDDAVRMLEAGASRLGTSGGVAIVEEGRQRAERERSGLAGSGESDARPASTATTATTVTPLGDY